MPKCSFVEWKQGACRLNQETWWAAWQCTGVLPAWQRIACGQACAVGAAGVLHVMVDGKHVVPGGHRLVLDGAERAQLAFTAKGVECRAGVPHTTLVQLLDHQGYPLQVSMHSWAERAWQAKALF